MDIKVCVNDFLNHAKNHFNDIKISDLEPGEIQNIIVPNLKAFFNAGMIPYTENELSEITFRVWLGIK